MKLLRFRFGIRTLFVLILLAAGCFAWILHEMGEVKRHKAAIQAIINNRGTARFQSGKYASLRPEETWFDEIWPHRRGVVDQVRFQSALGTANYNIPGTNKRIIYKADWSLESMLALQKHLEFFSQLHNLQFSKTPLPRHGLACIENLTQLESLTLDQTQITSADIVHLKDLTNLRWLSLRRTRIDGDCLVHLRQIQELETLQLGSTRIDDEGVKHLVGLPSLRSLSLDNTRVTDKGIHYIIMLEDLESLNLSKCDITDKGLRELEALSNLKSLSIQSDSITKEGAARLRRNLPNCDIRISSQYQIW